MKKKVSKSPFFDLKEADLLEFARLKRRLKQLTERHEEIRNRILKVHESTGDEIIRRGSALALIDVSERAYPQWKEVVRDLKGDAFIQRTIDNTEVTIVKTIKVKVKAA